MKQLQKPTDHNVAIACLHLGHGGIEMAVCTLANALCAHGYQVELLCTYRLCNPVYPLDSQVKITYLTNRKPNRFALTQALSEKKPVAIIRECFRAVGTLWAKFATMKRSIRDVRTGTVISTRHEYNRLLSRYGRPQVKKIAQLHQDHRFSLRLIRQIKRGYRNIACLVIPTRQAAQELQDLLRLRIPSLSCIAIPHFLMETWDSPIPEKKKQVIAVGRLHPEKGFERMLRMWGKVSPCYPDFILKIVGEGQELSRLQILCRDYKIERTVTFAGALPHDQVLLEMASSRCYWMTSLEESFGLVLIEAMSSGTPTIAFDVRTGPGEIIQNGINGYLIDDGDEEAMAVTLMKLMGDEDQCTGLGRCAKETAKQYEKEAVLQRWIELIES